MKNALKMSLVMIFALSLLIGGKALAADTAAATTTSADAATTATQAIDAVANEVTNTPEDLTGVTVDQPTSAPSSFGMFWQSLKENLAVAFTFDPVKKAEKRIAYAQARIEQANYILENSADAAIQEKARKMLDRANTLIAKAQESKDLLLQNPDTAKKQMLENMAKLEINTQRVISKMEDRAPADKLAGIDELKTKIDAREKDFLDKFLANPNVPDDVKVKMTELKNEIAAKQKERLDELAANKALIEKAKAGDATATAELKAKKEAKIEAEKKDVETLKARKSEIIEKIKDGDVSDLKELRGINKELLNKLELKARGLEAAKRQAEKAVEAGKPGAAKRLENITEQAQKVEDLKDNIQQRQEDLNDKVEEQKAETGVNDK